MGPQRFRFATSSVVLLIGLLTLSLAVGSMAKDQIQCTMCSSCDNPCQPILSPPPPSPPPPSPKPPPTGNNCPPPPSPPTPTNYYYSPPPPSGPSVPTFVYYSPPPPGGAYYPPPNGAYYPPPNGNYPKMSPPNPIVPYFPYYYYNPPPSSPSFSDSIPLKIHPMIAAISISFTFLLFL